MSRIRNLMKMSCWTNDESFSSCDGCRQRETHASCHACQGWKILSAFDDDEPHGLTQSKQLMEVLVEAVVADEERPGHQMRGPHQSLGQ